MAAVHFLPSRPVHYALSPEATVLLTMSKQDDDNDDDVPRVVRALRKGPRCTGLQPTRLGSGGTGEAAL